MEFRLIQRLGELDRAVLLAASSCRSAPLTRFLKLMSYSGIAVFWFIAALAWIILNLRGIQMVPRQTEFLRCLISPLAVWLICLAIKKTLRRRRPFQTVKNHTALVETSSDDSFPSSHAAAATAFFVALSTIHHPLTAIVGLWAFLVTFSRWYLGVHFPSDLLAGILLGVVTGAFMPLNLF